MRSVHRFARPLIPLALAATALFPRAAHAQTPPTKNVTLPAGSGQDALSVQIGTRGILACAGACGAGAHHAPVSGVPEEVIAALDKAKTSTITLVDGKRVVRIDTEVAPKPPEKNGTDQKGADVESLPREAEPPALWTTLLAAPLSGKGPAPVVLWSGWVGKKSGLEGEEAKTILRVEPLAKGSRIVIGDERADLTICGRPAVVSAREVDPATLTLAKGAMVDSLSADDKKKAEKVIATRETGPGPVPVVRLLRATAASSALEKRFGSLTDGTALTGWTEAKVGDGRGEWARMSASSDVGITGLSVQIRPTGAEVPDGASPKTLYLATDDRLFEMQLPETSWADKDARYEIKLPAEIRTSCLAVVLGDAHAKGVANPRVTIAEITARTPLDAMTYDALAAALAGGDDKARAAAAMLSKGDARAVAAVKSTWDKLDTTGKKLGMDVVDGTSCTDQAPFWADVLAVAKGKKMSGPMADPVVVHARDRLRRCGRASAPPLVKLLHEAPDPIRIVAAEELALVAPHDAIGAIVDVLPKVGDHVRRDLRAALARAAGSPKAKDALTDWVTPAKFGALGEVAKVDLLRAMGPALPGIDGGKKALFGLVTKDASFRTRYLLLAPTAELAAKGDTEAEAVVRAALAKDADMHVRTRAAEVAAKVPSLGAELVTAAGDAEVRVREAAVRALTQSAGQGNKLPPTAEAALVTRLKTDEWTFVRVSAAEALSAMPKSPSIDKSLAESLGDKSPDVRGRIVDGLGAHKAKAYASNVRERALASDEVVDVRARALIALGMMCDKDSLGLLTQLAQNAGSLTSEVDRRLGSAAVQALADLHPEDLKERLAPLADKSSPPLVREMAKAAISAKRRCK